MKSIYPSWFFIPAIALYVVFFAVPDLRLLLLRLTRWSLFDVQFIGFANFVAVLPGPAALQRLYPHASIYGFVTSRRESHPRLPARGAADLARSSDADTCARSIFFPVLISTIGVGIMFKSLLDPFHGIVNGVLGFFGLPQPGWFTDPHWRSTRSPASTSGRASASRP